MVCKTGGLATYGNYVAIGPGHNVEDMETAYAVMISEARRLCDRAKASYDQIEIIVKLLRCDVQWKPLGFWGKSDDVDKDSIPVATVGWKILLTDEQNRRLTEEMENYE